MKSKYNSIGLATLVLAALALMPFTEVSAQNLLTNPDFETGDLTGWDLVGPFGSQTVGAPLIGAQSGAFAVNLTAPSDGVPEVSQGIFGMPTSIPASPGDEFYLSGYMLTEVALPPVGTGATFGLLKIVFEDEFGTDLNPASVSVGQPNASFPGVESLPFLNGDSPVNEWVFTEAQGVAPAGTVSVAFLLLNVDFGNSANHPMWFDNISATKVVPGSPGDFDSDNDVDGRDFLEWQKGNSPNGTSGVSVDSGDLAVWQGAYGTPLTAATTAVPEPNSLILLLGLGVFGVVNRGQRAR